MLTVKRLSEFYNNLLLTFQHFPHGVGDFEVVIATTLASECANLATSVTGWTKNASPRFLYLLTRYTL